MGISYSISRAITGRGLGPASRQDPAGAHRTAQAVRVSIHQPHYLPWLPYLGKIAHSDCFVILDDVEFTRNGWQNRNKIKTPQGPLVLTVPVKQKLAQKIAEVEVPDSGWRKKHWASLRQAYAKAPYFGVYAAEVEAFFSQPWPDLVEPTCAMLHWLLKTLGLNLPVVRSSSLGVASSSTLRLIEIVRALGGKSYLSGAHALQAYLDPALFEEQAMPLHLFDWSCPPYSQLHGDFVANLAALDALFMLGPQATLELARQGGSTRIYAKDTA